MAKFTFAALMLLTCLAGMPDQAASYRLYGTIITSGIFNILTLNDVDISSRTGLSGVKDPLLFCDDYKERGSLTLWYSAYWSNRYPIPVDLALRWKIVDLERNGPLSFKGAVKRVSLEGPKQNAEVDSEGNCTVILTPDSENIADARCDIRYVGKAGQPMVFKLDFVAAGEPARRDAKPESELPE